MSGHSKWATTHRQKEAADAKRSSAFTKLSRLITVAAKEKGGDINTNFSLRMLVDKARDASMPKDNIEKAIKKGTGELEGDVFEELIYEAIGPFNTQFIVKCLTDNRNRTAGDIRHLFSKAGGAMSSVGWNFDQSGVIEIKENADKIKNIELELIDIGVNDISYDNDCITVYSNPADLQKIKAFFDEKNIKTEFAEVKYVPKDILDLNDEQTVSIENLVDEIDSNDDVVDWWGNF
ncbi:MAG: YebC/PmpR family DNA-binding transcriptional regulator [Patescibacteria group bacterium]